MEDIIVQITEWPENVNEYRFYAEMPQFPGMGESGKTAKEAFEELMISLKVKIAYDNKIEF